MQEIQSGQWASNRLFALRNKPNSPFPCDETAAQMLHYFVPDPPAACLFCSLRTNGATSILAAALFLLCLCSKGTLTERN